MHDFVFKVPDTKELVINNETIRGTNIVKDLNSVVNRFVNQEIFKQLNMPPSSYGFNMSHYKDMLNFLPSMNLSMTLDKVDKSLRTIGKKALDTFNPFKWISDLIDTAIDILKTVGIVVSIIVGVIVLFFIWPFVSPLIQLTTAILDKLKETISRFLELSTEYSNKLKFKSSIKTAYKSKAVNILEDVYTKRKRSSGGCWREL